MLTEGRPARRLSRRARMAMLLFVVPALWYSAATRSDDEPGFDDATTATPVEEVLLERVSCDVRNGTLAELVGQIMSGVDPAVVELDSKRLKADCRISADTGFTLEAKQIRRRSALSQALYPSGAGYYVKNGTIHITSQQGIEAELSTAAAAQRVARFDAKFARTYAVADLLQIDSGKADFDPLIKRIKSDAAPGTWGDVGQIAPFPNNLSLVISHNEAGHEAVESLLTKLRKSLVREAR